MIIRKVGENKETETLDVSEKEFEEIYEKKGWKKADVETEAKARAEARKK